MLHYFITWLHSFGHDYSILSTENLKLGTSTFLCFDMWFQHGYFIVL